MEPVLLMKDFNSLLTLATMVYGETVGRRICIVECLVGLVMTVDNSDSTITYKR